MAHVGILPIEGSGVFRIGADVAAKLSREVTYRTEYATCDDVSLNAREPDLNLVEPGGMGRSEVELHVGMLLKKARDLLGLVR
jgi:hypothetical protein